MAISTNLGYLGSYFLMLSDNDRLHVVLAKMVINAVLTFSLPWQLEKQNISFLDITFKNAISKFQQIKCLRSLVIFIDLYLEKNQRLLNNRKA